jgi:hypothetical protein
LLSNISNFTITTITTMSTKEIRTVTINLNGKTREVQIERYSPQHVWRISFPVRVICKFPTGGKMHGIPCASVVEKDGAFRLKSCQAFRNSNNAYPVAWEEEVTANSGWTGDKKAVA